MMTRKLLETWVLWVIVDIVYIGMFIFKGLYLTASDYAVYLVLAASALFAGSVVDLDVRLKARTLRSTMIRVVLTGSDRLTNRRWPRRSRGMTTWRSCPSS